MSERMTQCAAPGVTEGIADHGRKTRPEMIAQFRAYFERQLDEATRALAVSDEDLLVTTFRGPYARTNREVVTS